MFKQLMLVVTTLLLLCTNSLEAKVRGTTKTDGLYSKLLLEQRDLLIHLPSSYDKNKTTSYPVLFLLDGLRNFHHAVGSLDLLNQSHMAQEMIIVAIKNTHRTRDFTPTYNESYNQWGISGGADVFLDFLEQELIPHIHKNYRTNDLKVLAGHSLGGLLAIYSLQTRPQLFQAHFAFSPSLWWHDEFIIKASERFFTETPILNNYLYINMGNEGGQMLAAYQQYAKTLNTQKVTGFEFNAELMEQENHNTTAMVGLTLAYRRLQATFKCPTEVLTQGLAAIEQFYATLSEIRGYTITPSYRTIRDAASIAQRNKDQITGMKLLRRNIDFHPNTSDAYYRYAYALHELGENDKALKMVNTALAVSRNENVENNAYKTLKAYLLTLKNGP